MRVGSVDLLGFGFALEMSEASPQAKTTRRYLWKDPALSTGLVCSCRGRKNYRGVKREGTTGQVFSGRNAEASGQGLGDGQSCCWLVANLLWWLQGGLLWWSAAVVLVYYTAVGALQVL